ncbi:MAG: hypothetical protein CMJ89_03695 [Planctomycetes bacterium]|jgi:hypothetical protein|nr:hypothetical protein [Planctomycetota bacterium]
MLRGLLPSLVALLTLSALAQARDVVCVTVTGTVDFNGIPFPPLSGATPGGPMEMSFLIDSTVFVNSTSFPTRGYPIDTSSFLMTIDGISVGLQSPFPGTPYFVLRDNDPAVDGFFIANNVDFPNGLATDQPGNLGQFVDDFSVTYTGATLSSLDVLGALGSYDFTGLSVFNWTLNDGPFMPLGGLFANMTIETLSAPVPGLPTAGLLGLGALVALSGTIVLRRRALLSAATALLQNQRPI